MKLRCTPNRRLLGTTLALMALSTTPAMAAPVWTPPDTLSVSGVNPTNAQIAMDAAGNATAVWTEHVGPVTVIVSSTRRTGSATWTPAQVLSDTGGDSDFADIAANASGALVAVWTHYDGQDFVVQAREKAASGGVWGTTHTLSSSVTDAPGTFDEGEAQSPTVAVGASGVAVATWVRNDATKQILQARRLTNSGWSSASDVSLTGTDAHSNHVVLDGAGNATTVWLDFDGARGTITSSRLPASQTTWTAPQSVSGADAVDAAEPQIAVNAAGDATTVWRDLGFPSRIQSASWTGAGPWSTPETLTPADTDTADPQVGIDANGVAVAVWSKGVDGHSVVQSRRRIAGTWSPNTASLSTLDGEAFTPHIAVNPAGAAIVAWLTGGSVVQSSTLAIGSPVWSAPSDRSRPDVTGDLFRVAINANGNALSVWTTTAADNTNPIDVWTQASSFDVTAPSIIGMDVPTTAIVGEPIPMSANVTDNGSGLGPTAWDFGDGTLATAGLATTHTYMALGTFTVTMTPVNSFGGTATQQRQITITPAPVTPPVVATPGTTPPPPPPVVKAIMLSNIAGSCLKRPKKPCQARVAFKLDTAATVTLTVRRAGKLIGSFTTTGRLGPQVVTLPAKVGGKKIVAGKYQIALKASTSTATSNTITTNVIKVK
jgi:PKD domain